MTFILNTVKRPGLDRYYVQAKTELEEFFQLDIKRNPPNLILVPDRVSFDSLMGRKTEDWLVGLYMHGNVYLLDSENYEKESNHQYSEREYFALLKHELTHYYAGNLSHDSQTPVWLIEGIAVYLSGQNAFKQQPEKFSRFLEYFQKGGPGVYAESGFVVEFLVRKYGKIKLLELLRHAKKADTTDKFTSLFESVYGFDLNYSTINDLA
jgi:hypothetical protein